MGHLAEERSLGLPQLGNSGCGCLTRVLPLRQRLNRKRNAADKAPEQPWSTAMLAEIFMLRLEAAARAAKEAATHSQFVPITLPATKAS